MMAIYFSPMLLGLCLLFAVAVAATALWYTARPYAGPGFWMAGSWVLIAGVLCFVGFMATGNPVLNVLGNAGQLGGEALFLLGVFRIMERPLPWWIVVVSVGVMVIVNTHYWLYAGNSDFLMGVYSTIAGLLPLQAIWILLRRPSDDVTRPAQLLVGISLLVYSAVTLLRGYLGYHDWWVEKPYIPPYESFSYLLPYNFAIPAMVMGFVGVTLMTMQRILEASQNYAEQARYSAQRFEKLLGATSSGIMIVRDGTIVDANTRLESLAGRPRSELIQTEVGELFPRESQDLLKTALSGGNIRQLDVQALHATGNNWSAELSVASLDSELIVEVRDVSHRKVLEARLEQLATRDHLTGLLNRRAFDDLAMREIGRSLRHQRQLSLALIDLDFFKRINDTHGHAMGDEVLRQFARSCESGIRETDLLARYGGEEFVLLMPDTGTVEALKLLERIRTSISFNLTADDQSPISLTFSAGLSDCVAGTDLHGLLRRADRALYQAKAEGRNRIQLASPMQPE
jgi:diguanylate cyclase (GGDEF)-like protein/PAS domain S-box-containing protein